MREHSKSVRARDDALGVKIELLLVLRRNQSRVMCQATTARDDASGWVDDADKEREKKAATL